MKEYLVPTGDGEAQFIERRSRFIGHIFLTETEEEALARLKQMREQYWDATHNVYAYIIRDGATRFSDDGEPGVGAAGLIGALCNTVLFMTTLCLCFYNTEYIQGFVAALGSANAFLFVIAFVGVNGLVEGAVSLITGAAIAKAVVYSRGKLAARKTNA